MCLGCWALAVWHVILWYSVGAFSGEAREQSRVKDGGANGMGKGEGCGKVAFVTNKQGVDTRSGEGIQVTATVQSININHHGGRAVNGGPVVSK